MHQSSPRRRGGAAGETASLRSSSKPKQRQIQQQQQQQQQTPLAIGERIVWMADNGAEFGTVRWIGVLEDVSEDWTVGVEFDNAVGTGTGKYQNEQLFRARMNHASLIPVLGLVKEADFLGTHSSATTTSTAAAAASSSSVMSSTGNECPVFSEIQLDLVADRISKHDWPVVAQCLGVPSTMLGDVSVITILNRTTIPGPHPANLAAPIEQGRHQSKECLILTGNQLGNTTASTTVEAAVAFEVSGSDARAGHYAKEEKIRPRGKEDVTDCASYFRRMNDRHGTVRVR